MSGARLGARPRTSLDRLGRGGRWAAIGLVALVIVGFAQTRPGRAALSAAGVAGDEGGYVELELVSATAQPHAGRRVAVELEAAVANAHEDARRGTWRLELRDAELVRGTDAGTVELAAGGRATLKLAVVVRCAPAATAAWVGVRVDPAPGRSVGSWQPCTAEGA